MKNPIKQKISVTKYAVYALLRIYEGKTAVEYVRWLYYWYRKLDLGRTSLTAQISILSVQRATLLLFVQA